MRRMESLDVLRGIAILGTLGTNIWIFTDPNGPYGSKDSLPAPRDALEAGLVLLTNGKFLGLLAVLFGAGMELQYQNALRRGRRWPGWYLWRAALLFVEGLLHYLFVFEFDVLMGYAVVSVAVAFLIGRSDRAVRRWIAAMVTLHLAMVAVGMAQPAPPATGSTDLYSTGPWTDQVAARITNFGAYRAESIFIIPLTLALFLIGSRLMRAGVFEASGAALRRRLIMAGLVIAAPLNVATAFAGPSWFLVSRYVLPPVVALGLLGLVTALLMDVRISPGPIRSGLTAVGRTALSGYVFQNMVAGALCYGWGLGLAAKFANVRSLWTVAAWAGICALTVLLSVLWLRRFDRGPLELFWNRLLTAPQMAKDRL